MLGHKTVMRSDHAALQYLKRVKEPVGQQAHWMDFIEQFDLEICHRKGASHANTDALSRKPRCEQDDQACRQCVGCKRDPAGIPAGRWPGERGGRHEHRRAIHGACTECEGRAHPQGSPRTGAVTSRVRARKRDSQGDPSAATAVPNSHGMRRVLTAVPIVRRSAIQRYGMGRDLGLEWCVNRRRQLYHDQPVEQTRPPTATDTCRHASDFPMKWTYAHLAELQRKDPAIGVVYE